MASIPRILAVDSTDQVGTIIRGALTLLDRRFILVEVPNAEDALDELRNTQVDLMVTAYSLPDLNGLELASRAVRESAGTPVIVLSGASDPEIEREKLENVPFTYLVRPIGEPFLRAVRMGLDGVASVAAQEADVQSSEAFDLGPIPDIDLHVLQDHLMPMVRETTALGAFVANRLGRIIYTEGITGYGDFDMTLCAASLAPHFAHTVNLREIIGGNAATLQYFDGNNYDLFAIALGLHYFVVLVFDGAKRAAFGPVTNYGRKEADSIIDKIGAEAWNFRRQIRQTITQNMPVITSAVMESIAIPEIPEEPEYLGLEEPLVKLEPVQNLDIDRIFNQQIDENSFDDMFNETDLTQDNIFTTGDNHVSFDEAMNMGILDE
jgi:CheY-like chemotaxis protein